MPQPPYAIIPTRSHRRPRYGLLVLGGFVLAGAGVAAALLLRPAGALPDKAELVSIALPASLPAAPPAGLPIVARSASVCITCGTVEAVLGPESDKSGKPGPAYRVQVRMDDGTVRSFTSATQPQPGAAVRVNGDSFRVVGSGG